jgi:cytochrome c biogenesis protein CcmG/thiol:disulfide interchange protein DsbE
MTRLLPLIGFFALVCLLGFGMWWNTRHETNEVPSPLIGKPAPEFKLPLLYDSTKSLSKADLLGKPYLVNVFGSWCETCQYEHPILIEQVKPLGIKLIGMAWKDQREDAKRWLGQFGDPYDTVISDVDGRTGIDFGVYMAPESFLVDAQGTIRYKRIGMFTPELIERELLPELAKLQQAKP